MGWIDNFVKEHREGVMYLVCGAWTVLVSWLTYSCFVWAGIEVNASNILSWTCAVAFAFVVNKWFVFSSRSTEKKVLIREIGSFFLARIGTGIVAFLLFPILIYIGMDQGLFNVEGLYARVTVSIVEIALNYVASKFYVFKPQKRKTE
jgi:putative flippase GtrA